MSRLKWYTFIGLSALALAACDQTDSAAEPEEVVPTVVVQPTIETEPPLAPPAAAPPGATQPVAAPPAAPQSEAPQSEAPQPQPTPTPTAPPVADGWFTSGQPVDLDTLPELVIPPTGMGPFFCGGGDFTGPAITMDFYTNNQAGLCLYSFPTGPDSPDINVTLTAPDGTTYSDTFSYNPENDTFEGTRGAVGNIRGPDSGMLPPGVPPHIVIFLLFSADLPLGEWGASARTADGSIDVPSTVVSVEHSSPLTSVLPAAGDPFAFPPQAYLLSRGPTLSVSGVGYTPGPVTVAFYWQDPSHPPSEFGTPVLTPRYATELVVNEEGRFQTGFVVGVLMSPGTYYVVAAPTITPQARFDPFTDSFAIQ